MKTIALAVLACTLVGCGRTNIDRIDEHHAPAAERHRFDEMDLVRFNGHTYVMWLHPTTNGGAPSMIHDPDCEARDAARMKGRSL